MPFFKDAMSHGNLYIEFIIDFPQHKQIKNIGELKKVRNHEKLCKIIL